MKRTAVTSGAPWEEMYGYRRAVRVGPWVCVSGTAPVADNGETFGVGEPFAQAVRCFEIALKALRELGGGPEHVIRTRMYVTDIRFADEFGRAHAQFFAAQPPASTMVEVRKLVGSDMLIEVELDAWLDEPVV
jgi:enamine deaminase RidA (YjgF/YER057c/UK114 family)